MALEVLLVYVVFEELYWKGDGPPMCWPLSFGPPCSSAHGQEYTQTPALHRHPREILGLWAQNPSHAHTTSKQRGVYD